MVPISRPSYTLIKEQARYIHVLYCGNVFFLSYYNFRPEEQQCSTPIRSRFLWRQLQRGWTRGRPRSSQVRVTVVFKKIFLLLFNPLNAELNPICHLLVLLGDLMFMGPCIVSIFQYISNKMQRYTVYLYLETALHVSGGTSTHHQ